MITGRVMISLHREPDASDYARDRRALSRLEESPDGAEVIVDIGARQYVSEDAAHWLHQHDHRLQIVIQGSSPSAVATFVRAARAGEWSVVGA